MVYKKGFPPWGKRPHLFPATVPPRIPFWPSFPITPVGLSAYQKHSNLDVSITPIRHGSTRTSRSFHQVPTVKFLINLTHHRIWTPAWQPLTHTKVPTEHSCTSAGVFVTLASLLPLGHILLLITVERYSIHLEVPHPITHISFSLPAKGCPHHITENLHCTLKNHFN